MKKLALFLITNILLINFAFSQIIATGGTITYSGGKTIHTFTSSGTFSVSSGSGNVQVLVVGGGGGGGNGTPGTYGGGGGGGAGGYLYDAAHAIIAQTYTITVGNGGSGTSSNATGSNGGNSIFHNLTSYGGGGGGLGGSGSSGGSGASGGSGGGGGVGYDGGSGTSGQGYAGGHGSYDGCNTGGGGGGAGGLGGNTSPYEGAKGPGLANSITGSSITYATGGLGSPAVGQSTVNGAANTGNGGNGNHNTMSGSGGSGIVIISYTTPTFAPTVTTQAITNIASTTATGNGTISSDGGAAITERGICWNTSTTPTTSNSKATSTGTTGVFNSSMTALNVATLYYVRAYAINSVGISYGNEVTFTTLAILPSVTTQEVSNISVTTATGNGNVTNNGGAAITERGICWNTSTAPTTANNKATSSGTTGAFAASMTGLTAGTSYYVRAYAINSVGTSYGNEVTFNTISPAIVNWNNSNVQEITLTANRVFTFTNGKSGGVYSLIIKQNPTGGWTSSWPSNVKWAGGVVPSLTTTSNAINLVEFIYDGTNYLEKGIKIDIK